MTQDLNKQYWMLSKDHLCGERLIVAKHQYQQFAEAIRFKLELPGWPKQGNRTEGPG